MITKKQMIAAASAAAILLTSACGKKEEPAVSTSAAVEPTASAPMEQQKPDPAKILVGYPDGLVLNCKLGTVVLSTGNTTGGVAVLDLSGTNGVRAETIRNDCRSAGIQPGF